MDISDEKWASVVEYEGLYEISTLGQIRSLRTGKFLLPRYTNNAYETILLTNKFGKISPERIHRLMTQSFMHLPVKSKLVVLHLDRCVYNNVLDNLEIADYRRPRGSSYYSVFHNTSKSLTHDEIHEVLGYLDDYSMAEISKIMGVSTATISQINQWKEGI